MKKFLQFFAVVLLLAIASTGCKPKVYGPTPIVGQVGKGNKGGPESGETPGNPANDAGQVLAGGVPSSPDEMNKGPVDPELLKAEMVHFDLDSAVIKNSEKSKLKKVAEYMKANPMDDILIGGHCDERGTEQYNLSLGEKRAQAAREYLATLGASAKDIYTQSFGETQPLEQLHHEASYSKNRRAEFVVVHPAGK